MIPLSRLELILKSDRNLNNSDEWHEEKTLSEKIFCGSIREEEYDEAENEM